jgi:hypothetical protein
VSKQREDRIGLLVVRAYVETDTPSRLLVELLQVNSRSPDRVIGMVDSSSAASLLVRQWLDSLEVEAPPDGVTPGT